MRCCRRRGGGWYVVHDDDSAKVYSHRTCVCVCVDLISMRSETHLMRQHISAKRLGATIIYIYMLLGDDGAVRCSSIRLDVTHLCAVR